MKITRYTVTIGLNDKDTKTQIIPTIQAKEIVNQKLLETGNDATIYDVNGVYTHENGERVTEHSIQVEILFSKKRQILDFASRIKAALNQETVVIKKDKINSVLY